MVTDIQPDFLPGGALPVPEGDAIIGPVRRLMLCRKFAVQVATQDWHPRGHISFASSHAERAPFDTIELYRHSQMLWPDHCIQGTAGAALYSGLPWEKVDAIVRKGADPLCDSYSGFRNNWDRCGERPPTGLAGYLRDRGVREIYVCGLARDFCVKWSAEDAVEAGFTVFVVWDCTRPVIPSSDDRVRRDLTSRGVGLIGSDEISRR